MAEKMNTIFAVFNGHVNEADRLAREVMRKRCPVWLERVEMIEREGGGIMAIFSNIHTFPIRPWTRRYADLVTQFVNENRIDREAT